MPKLRWIMMSSLDGYMEGPQGELDWQVGGDALTSHLVELLDSVDTLLLGRRSYDVLARHWPTATAAVAPRMNQLPKVVFSRGHPALAWSGARLADPDVCGEVAQLKATPGKGLALLGSAELAASLLRLGAIDELRLFLHPVVLGGGTPAFKGGAEAKREFRLTKSWTLPTGVAVLHYEPDR